MELAKLISVASISLLGAISPGPDFAVVTKNCLSGSFRAGILTTLGVTAAMSIHVTYSLLGIALLIAEWPLLFLGLKYIGAAYLFYLGIMLLQEKKMSPEGSPKDINAQAKKKKNPFISGFFCNILNPKATLFVISLFAQFVDPTMSLIEKMTFGVVIVGVGAAWFVFLSFLITHRLLHNHFAKFQYIISKGMGVILCLLALYVAIV